MTASAAEGFEAIARGFYIEGLLVEGPDIWFTDIGFSGVQKVGSDTRLLPERTMIGGLQLNEDGALLVSGAGGVEWAHPASGQNGTLIDGLDGVNEMYACGRGGLIYGTIDLPAILRGEKPGSSTIEYLSPDGEKARLRDGLTFANGLALSPGQDELYFNESFSATRAFPIVLGGQLGEPRTLSDMPDCDGMALDVDGNMWITGFASRELRCLAADGTEIRRLKLPGNACTNVRFGGPDMRDLYVAVVDPAAAKALADAMPLQEQTSTLFRTRSPVAGARRKPTRFKLQ